MEVPCNVVVDCKKAWRPTTAMTVNERKATRRKAREMAAAIVSDFELIYRLGVHDFSFFSETDKLESALRDHFRSLYPGLEHLRGITRESLSWLRAGARPASLRSLYAGSPFFSNMV